MSLDSFFNFLVRLFGLFGLTARLSWARTWRDDDHLVVLNGPRRLRFFFENAGGAFLKLGQILSLRNDLLPKAYIDELLCLLSRVPQTPYPLMEAVFTEEYQGRTPQDFFKEFDRTPIASASIGQVYRARLKTGELVAVKIQRPGVRDQFENDFLAVRFFANVFSLLNISQAVDWHEVAEEFFNWTRRELDFLVEAQNAETIARLSSKRANIFIPRYYSELSTPRVLIVEYVEKLRSGETIMRELANNPNYNLALKKENINLAVVSESFVSDMMRQFFIDGFFHADPHPANIYILPQNRLGYLDFGIIGQVGVGRSNMLAMLFALAEKDMLGVAKSLFACSRFAFANDLVLIEQLETKENKEKYKLALAKLEEIMTDDLVAALTEILSPWYKALEAPATIKILEDRSTARVFVRIVNSARHYAISLPREATLFFRTISIVDMVAMRLSPDCNIMRAIENFFREFPLEQAQGHISEGTYERAIDPEISPLHNVSYEALSELRALDQERLFVAREHLGDLLGHYAERYDEIRQILKG